MENKEVKIEVSVVWYGENERKFFGKAQPFST